MTESSHAFSLYMANFSSYSVIYDAFASVILWLRCLFIRALILMLETEINVKAYYACS